MTLLVIGAGNEDCGDDAAGLLVVRAIAARAVPGVTCQEAPPDGLALIDLWRGAPRVVVVDASCSGCPPGTVTRLDAIAAPLPAALRPFTSHGFGIVETIELARALGRLPERLAVYAIEGTRFEPGDAPSPEVVAAVETVAGRVLAD